MEQRISVASRVRLHHELGELHVLPWTQWFPANPNSSSWPHSFYLYHVLSVSSDVNQMCHLNRWATAACLSWAFHYLQLLASARYKHSSTWMMLSKFKQHSVSWNARQMGQMDTGWWQPWQQRCSRQVNGGKSRRLWKKTTVLEKSLRVIRCEDNFHYLKITVTSISSPVNLEKKTKF